MKKYIKAFLITATLMVGGVAGTFTPEAAAQCPMCRIAAESNLKDGGTAGRGLNAGILYMLAAPYLLVAGIGVYWYRNRRRDEEEA